MVGFFALTLDLAAKCSYMTICLLSVASQNAYGKIKRKKILSSLRLSCHEELL